jgi:outer membrane protein
VTKTRIGLLAGAGAVATALGWANARAESLADAIGLAYQSNPSLQNQRAQLRVTDETYVQARAGYRPQVNVEVNATRQDYANQTTNSGSTVLTVSQPIYSGGRTAAAVSAAEADILAGRETLRATEAAVLQQVVQVYADVLRDQEGVSIRQVNLAALTDQLTEATARAKAGDLTRTDVAQSQGYASQAKVDLASARAQLETSKAAYTAVVGQTPEVLEPLPPLPNLPVDVNQAFATAEAGNPQLRSTQYAEQAARMRTAEARDQRLPTISLRAQFGYNGPVSAFTPNVYGRDAVASASITQPLFAGGVINSQVRQQIERQASARAQTEQTRRQMIQQISQAWGTYLSAHENIANSEEAVQANAIAYEGVQKERRVDLRSTLEVLSIEQSLRQSELARAAARHDAYVSAANLLQTMGMLEAQRLVPGINVYDPAKAFNKVRTAGAVPWEAIPAALDHLTVPTLQRLPPPPTAPVTVRPN